VISAKTQLTITGVTKPEIADITVDDKAVAIFEEDEEELTLKALVVWPGTASPEAADNQVNTQESTASAEPSPQDRRVTKERLYEDKKLMVRFPPLL